MNRKLWLSGWAMALSVVLVLVGAFIAIYPEVAGYWRFSWRSQTYYLQVAQACDALILKNGPSRNEIRGQATEHLPMILRDLKPSYVIIDTNYVMLRIGGGQMSHAIIWGCVPPDLHPWQLYLGGGDRPGNVVLFQKSK